MSNNNWGRDQQPSNAGGSGSSMGLIVAVLASLVVGAGGGYGAVRLSGQDKTEALQQLSTEKADLQKQLDQAKADLADLSASASNGNSTVADLQDRLAERTRELDRLSESLSAASAAQQKEADAHEKRLAALASERRDLQATLAAQEKALTSAETRTVVLEQRVAELSTQLRQTDGADREELIRLTNIELPRLRDRLARAEEHAAALESANADLQNQLTAADKRMASLERQLAAARDTTTEPPRDTTAEPGRERPPVPLDRKRRQDKVVIEALNNTPGVERLSKADYDRLKSMLISGQCVTAGLEAVFDRVPVITLRNLMRDLKSKC
ncbi:hypothetical protein HFC70_15165 [Agrobacterium sp. a22-2]|uniref:hypothetical protein n=1 Tax=Agrobacterium sp. a22-2 TaxID=2283840 RepID=UPI0014489AE1|nr:hypothetical protein [Agrobacterium sp. a22-2]NKN37691.1 hypothetical protein [Agrobacterium sp. a22-2]